jgi:hypothetical protein
VGLVIIYGSAGGMGLTLLEVLGRSVNELEGDELEATLLETADDVSDETALDAVGLLHGKTNTILFNQTRSHERKR